MTDLLYIKINDYDVATVSPHFYVNSYNVNQPALAFYSLDLLLNLLFTALNGLEGRRFVFCIRWLNTLLSVSVARGNFKGSKGTLRGISSGLNALSKIFSDVFRRRVNFRTSGIHFVLLCRNLRLHHVIFTYGKIQIIAVKRRTSFSIRTFFRRRVGASSENLCANDIAIMRRYRVINRAVGRPSLSKYRYYTQENGRVLCTQLIRKGSIYVAFSRGAAILFRGNLFNGVCTMRFVTFVMGLQFEQISMLRLSTFNNTNGRASPGDRRLTKRDICQGSSTPPRTISRSIIIHLMTRTNLSGVVLFVTFLRDFLNGNVITLNAVTRLRLLSSIVPRTTTTRVNRTSAPSICIIL